MKQAETYENALAGKCGKGGILIYEDADVAALFPKRKADLHKGNCGSAAILAGYGSLGAPLLAAGACLKSGAGYTHLWLPSAGNPDTDALRCAVVAAKYPACIAEIYAGEPFSADSVAFGMGAGAGDPQREMLELLLRRYEGGALVLDADALNMLGACGADLLRTKKCRAVVTPHPKEFSRLTGKPVDEIMRNFVGSAKRFANEYGVTVVLKSHRTVITDGERVAVNPTGSPALAKGGSGDTLAGFLAGTLARGLSPFEAAVASCYVCGRAGELAARDLGEYSPDAADVIGYLGPAILSLKPQA